MSPDLFQCLQEERSIFRIFDASRTIGDFEAFHSPRRESIAHWNLAYPIRPDKTYPAPHEAAELFDHYAVLGLLGHLISPDRRFQADAAEECEYFRMDKSPRVAPLSLRLQKGDLRSFASVIQRCFILSDQSKETFQAKLEKLQSLPGSQFFVIAGGDGRTIGCANSIRSESGADFLFNIGTLPEFSDLKYIEAIVRFLATKTARPLYTYHRHPTMREDVLGAAGFRSLGVLYCVPLDRFLMK